MGLYGRRIRVKVKTYTYGARYYVEAASQRGWFFVRECQSHSEVIMFLRGQGARVDNIDISFAA